MSCHLRPHTSRRIRIVPVHLLAISLAALTAAASADDWPTFRGPHGDGTIRADSLLAGDAKIHLEKAWSKEIGSAYAGIAVAHDTAVTFHTDGTDDIVIALNAKTGATLWEYKVAPYYKGHDGSHDGGIVTPAISAGVVYAIAPRGEFVALDLASGKPIWTKNLVTDYGAKKPHYGFSSSPLLWDGKLLLGLGAPDKAIAALDATTGDIVWAVGADTVNYQSPVLVMDDANKPTLYACGDNKIFCIDPATGTVKWEAAHEGSGGRGAASLSPVLCGDDLIFLANKDESSAMFEIVRGRDGVTLNKKWENRKIRNSYNIPVYYDGHVYAYSSRFLTCVDAETGDVKWRSRQPGDGFITLVNDKLVILTKESSLHIVAASPTEYREIAALPLYEELSWMNPAIVDNHIYVRGFKDIACVEVKSGTSSASDEATPLASAAGKTDFAALLRKVNRADGAKKNEIIEAYVAEHPQSPILEGNDTAHFYYFGEAKDVALASELFGARQERPMNHVPGTNLFFYTATLDPDTRINYRYIVDYKEVLDPRNDRKTTTGVYGPDMEMGFGPNANYEMSWMSMPKWEAPDFLEEADEADRGRVDNHKITSEVYPGERSFDVYVPKGYDDGDERYPVVFVHGGPMALNAGQYPTALDNLIAKRRIAPMLVVFINDGPQGNPLPYIEMVASELVPFMDENYRTKADANARANVGSGFPGFHALLTTLSKPDVFQRTGIQSIFLFSMMEQQVNGMLANFTPKGHVVYSDWGKYDLRNPHEAWDLGDSNKKLYKKLDKKGFVMRGGEANDGTDWSSFRNRIDDMLAALFPVNERVQ